jgi:NAD(P)-dependent dehydrogenase (short-subunit alcohol dehydrogenase family)
MIGSMGSFSRERASPPAYIASKSAVAQLAQHAASNLAQYQIRVNTVTPSCKSPLPYLPSVDRLPRQIVFPSEMARPIISTRDPKTEEPDHQAFMSARRFGTEEEMAGTILYLASRAGAYCDGLILTNDGGRLAIIPSTY